MRLDGKRILITGAGGGQGKAALDLFVREGAHVIGCDVQPGKAEYTVDLTDPDAAKQWIEDCAGRLDGIDVLYNNAAGYGFAPFAEMDLKLWRHVIHAELDMRGSISPGGAEPSSTRRPSRRCAESRRWGWSRTPPPRVA